MKQVLKVAAKSDGSGMRNVCPSHEQRICHTQFGMSIILQKFPQHSCVCASVYNSGMSIEQ